MAKTGYSGVIFLNSIQFNSIFNLTTEMDGWYIHQELGPPTLTFSNVIHHFFGNCYKAAAGIDCGLYLPAVLGS